MYTVIYCQETQFFSDAGHLSILLNGYGFRIALVPNLTDAIESWDNPDENNNSPLTVITSVRRGDVIAVFLIFATTEEEVNLTYNFRTLKPDGTFSENTELIIHNGIANRNRYMYSRQMPIIVYYSYDQVGTYQYYLEIYDSGAYLCRAILEFQVK
jgi:hypothetical protein